MDEEKLNEEIFGPLDDEAKTQVIEDASEVVNLTKEHLPKLISSMGLNRRTDRIAMAYDKDSSIRKAGYDAELKVYETFNEAAAASLNGVKGEVITVSDLRGYESPLEMTLIGSRMDRETLDAMLDAIKESLPQFRKYFRKKGELLGHKKGLPFYELFAPMGKSDMTFTYDEARDFIVKNFI